MHATTAKQPSTPNVPGTGPKIINSGIMLELVHKDLVCLITADRLIHCRTVPIFLLLYL